MKPKAKREQAIELYRFLQGKGWRKAREIPMNARLVRAICSEFPEHFISTQRGYSITATATDAQLEEAIADLRSRMKHLNNRASALERVLQDRGQPRMF
jgi:hypothetical protein